jgi:hypothetical protein
MKKYVNFHKKPQFQLANIIWLFLALVIASCSSKSNSTTDQTPTTTPKYRFFDREIYLARGSSVTPDESSAQEVVKVALSDLELKTDLGAGYFIISYDDDSILQPVAQETKAAGRNWHSFIQTWDDALINDYLAKSGGDNPSSDQDTIVAKNKSNAQQFYMITRLSCYLAGESCSFASQQEAKMLVWRSFGYLIGMRIGSTASSAIMKPSMDSLQESADEQRKFIAEFNSRLELIKNTSLGGIQ